MRLTFIAALAALLIACGEGQAPPRAVSDPHRVAAAADLVRAKVEVLDTTLPTNKRIVALRIIERQDKAAFGALDAASVREPLQAAAEKENQDWVRRAQEQRRREAAAKKREGVTLGMTTEDVLASMWGKPRHVNRTTNRWGVREQWVYEGGYLYFDNGILTTVQN